MPTNSVFAPFQYFSDADGLALENGYVYIGQPGFEARSNPKASFFDLALTIPTGTASGSAVRTRAGLPINTTGAPAAIYVDGDYSMTVTDRNGVVIYTTLNATLALNEGGSAGPVLWPDGDFGAVGGGFISESNTGFVRPAAGTVQTVGSGALLSEISPSSLRTTVPFLRAMTPTFSAGTNAQGQAPISTDFTVITTAAASPSGVTLPTAVAGRRMQVWNRAANRVNVYPASGGTIGNLALNAPISLPANGCIEVTARSATQWEAAPLFGSLTALSDPNAQRVLGWDDTANQYAFFGAGTGISLAGNLISASAIPITWEGNVSTSGAGPISVSTTLPATATEIYFLLAGPSLSGTDHFIIQLGTASTWITSGYDAAGTVSGGASGGLAASNGAIVFGGTATRAPKGVITFYKTTSSNVWYWTIGGTDGLNSSIGGGGSVTAIDQPTRIRIDSSGSNTFAAGNVRVGYR